QGTRFDPKTTQGDRYRKRYWNQTYFEAVEVLKAATARHGISMVSAAHRWMFHHSMLDQAKGDGVIIGVSSLEQAVQNLGACEEGPLPEDVVEAFNVACEKTKAIAPTYYR
ncbi:hypothetical protein HDU96_000502, partial [Phlyctochytrium bullatum]